MRRVCLLWLLFALASVYSESVRETETWTLEQLHKDDSESDLGSSGDIPYSSDFEFHNDDEDEVDYDEMSGSGDESDQSPYDNNAVSIKPDDDKNKIPGQDYPYWPVPTVNEMDVVRQNEIHPQSSAGHGDSPSNILMSHAGDESMFNKKEVIAALVAGGFVGLVFAVVLVLLLVYRMKKKDEGSYVLGKKPIYKKAPTKEIFA